MPGGDDVVVDGPDGSDHARPVAGFSSRTPPTAPRPATGSGEANVVPLRRPRAEDSLWAVIASLGRQDRIAEIYPTREAALADRSWRAAQVAAYAGFLAGARQPLPHYSVAPIRRSDLPKAWRPLPALGFLRGTFI